MGLEADDFAAFFKSVYGVAPFAWQAELCARVCSGQGWPAALDVPTGMGKTAVLDVAVFSLSRQAHLPASERTVATRTFLVVDRRVIVDQAHERALRLAAALGDPAAEGVLAEMARRLRLLAGAGNAPLSVARLRGGTTWASRWLRSPRLPAVVTGTVDQLGSRLLFRGYGVTRSMRPVDAALCGTDSLLLLDEAHLAQPFLRSVRAVATYESRVPEPVLPQRPLRSVLLSATLPAGADGSLDDVFRCRPGQETSSAARARLEAVKRTALLDVRARGDLAPVLAELAMDARNRGAERVAVVCNTVSLAREVFQSLPQDEGFDRALLVGRCRDHEREQVAATYLRDRLSSQQQRPTARPIVIVATQTVEVGADIDIDAVITEACPLDALTQRLGRLNRLGRQPVAEAVVVHDAAVHGPEARTPVYGQATARTWAWLVEQAGPITPVPVSKVLAALSGAVRLDLGPAGVLAGLSPAVRGGLASESPLAPVIVSATLDLWARTNPEPVPDQAVAPFLHGLEQPRNEVSFCWRAGLTTPEAWEEELEQAPPAAHELVTVSYAEAVRVLSRSRSTSTMSDLEGALVDDDVEDFGELPPLNGYVIAPDGRHAQITPTTRPRPGSTVVLDSEQGGHDKWGWTGRLDGTYVADVADLGETGPCRLRLRRAVWGPAVVDLGEDDDDGYVWDMVEGLLLTEADERRRAHLEVILGQKRLARVRRTQAAGPVVLAPRHRVISELSDDDTEELSDTSSRTAVPVTLEDHLRDVERRSGQEAEALGLPDHLVRAVALAGLAHDLGKADRRFQLLLHRANRYALELAPAPLAKSGGPAPSYRQRQVEQRASGWPRGMRHEAVSAAVVRALVQEQPWLFNGVDHDLVLHLVAAHHGHSRALLPPVVDEAPGDVRAVLPASGQQPPCDVLVRSDDGVVDWSQPSRFARLNARYGRWGLALLETLLRLSDIAVSEEYESPPGERDVAVGNLT